MTNVADKARIVLFGREGGFSDSVLERLLGSGLCIVGVVISSLKSNRPPFPVKVTQPEKSERFEKIARQNKIPVLTYRDINQSEFLDELQTLRSDIILVACFEEKIPQVIWGDLRIPCWNLHPSMLPKHRGRSPLFWQIAKSEPDTGLTLHQVSDKLDAGDIIIQKSVLLPLKRDNFTLNNWVAEHGIEIFLLALEQYINGKLKQIPQDENCASYHPENKYEAVR